MITKMEINVNVYHVDTLTILAYHFLDQVWYGTDSQTTKHSKANV